MNINFKKSILLIFAFIFIFIYFSAAYSADEQSSTGYKRHVVKDGDTLSSIAKEYLGDSSLWPELLKYNNISDPHWIYNGDIIIVPAAEVLREIKKAKTEEEKQQIIQNQKFSRIPELKSDEEFAKESASSDEIKVYSTSNSSRNLYSSKSDMPKSEYVVRLNDLKRRLNQLQINEREIRYPQEIKK
ncbi:MAG: LysM peptidoglycan-binding domain-containing protein [Candidatus Wallbacteria bacterium]